MEFTTLMLMALGLAMDAFAVSVVSGATYHQLQLKHIFRMGAFFGGFQAVMPALGFALAMSFRAYVAAYGSIIAFSLLVIIGLKMIYESFKIGDSSQKSSPAKLKMVFILAIATSVDALAVGVTLSVLAAELWLAVTLIGAVTFVLTFLGVYLGKRFSHFAESRIEALGGLVLIGLGVKILLEYLLG